MVKNPVTIDTLATKGDFKGFKLRINILETDKQNKLLTLPDTDQLAVYESKSSF
jgi:hypothetical protein